MRNQQLSTLENQEKQLLISLYLGDGCFRTSEVSNRTQVITSCIQKDYLLWKKSLCVNLQSREVTDHINMGYKKYAPIYKWSIPTQDSITEIANMSLEEKVNNLDELGLALWFYDDASMHKEKLFYNLCTHAFSYEDQLIFIEALERKFNISATLRLENKKDGRKFYYLSVNKFNGAFEVSEILNKYHIDCFDYKVWSSSTSLLWRTLQEEWKSRNPDNIVNFRKYMKYTLKTKQYRGMI